MSSGSAELPPSLPGRGAQTRTAILEAAIVRFGRDGYRATSVADIARDAGVGGTITYAYFPNKEALFLAALDEDAAAVMSQGMVHLFSAATPADWRATLLPRMIEAVEGHPLARRVMAGLEPGVMDRVIDIPAMAELRKAVAEKVRAEQLVGTIRPDIDPIVVASGAITIILSLMMSILQIGPSVVTTLGPDVLAVFQAAFEPPATPGRRMPADPSRLAPAGR